jgi:hypothetical protein
MFLSWGSDYILEFISSQFMSDVRHAEQSDGFWEIIKQVSALSVELMFPG